MVMASLAFVGDAKAAIARFTFGTTTTPTYSATSQDPNVQGTSVIDFSASGVPSGSGYDISTGNFVPSFKFAAGNGSQNLADYISFTVVAASGYKLNLTTLTFDAGGQDSNGHWAVSSGVAGYGVNIGTGDAGDATFVPQSVDLSGAAYQNLTSITFHLYDWNTTGTQSDWYDNITLNGSLVAVPEPVNVALGVFGLCAVAIGAGRRVCRRVRS